VLSALQLSAVEDVRDRSSGKKRAILY
jgi:hypothetical protein